MGPSLVRRPGLSPGTPQVSGCLQPPATPILCGADLPGFLRGI